RHRVADSVHADLQAVRLDGRNGHVRSGHLDGADNVLTRGLTEVLHDGRQPLLVGGAEDLVLRGPEGLGVPLLEEVDIDHSPTLPRIWCNEKTPVTSTGVFVSC